MNIEESTSEFGDGKLFSLINLSSEVRLAEKEVEREESPSRLNLNLRTRLDVYVVDDEYLLLERYLRCVHEVRVYYQRTTPWIVEDIDKIEMLIECPPLDIIY